MSKFFEPKIPGPLIIELSSGEEDNFIHEEPSFESAAIKMKDYKEPSESDCLTLTHGFNEIYDPFCAPALPGQSFSRRIKPHRLDNSISTSFNVVQAGVKSVVHKKVIAASEGYGSLFIKPFDKYWLKSSKTPNF